MKTLSKDANDSKAAKLKLAREKAKRWAMEQKKSKKKKASDIVEVPGGTDVLEEEMSVITTHTTPTINSTKRKRPVQDSDDDNASTGPYGTPKVRKPNRKKTNLKATPVQRNVSEMETEQNPKSSESSQMKSTYPSNTPNKKKKAETSSEKKKEKLRLAREKAAKWAREQKYGKNEELKPAKKSSRSSYSGSSSNIATIKKTKTRRKSYENESASQNFNLAPTPSHIDVVSSPSPVPTSGPIYDHPPVAFSEATPIMPSEVSIPVPKQTDQAHSSLPKSTTSEVQSYGGQHPSAITVPQPHCQQNTPPQTAQQSQFQVEPTFIPMPSIPPPNQQWKEAFSTIKESINKAAADAIEVVDRQEQNLPSQHLIETSSDKVLGTDELLNKVSMDTDMPEPENEKLEEDSIDTENLNQSGGIFQRLTFRTLNVAIDHAKDEDALDDHVFNKVNKEKDFESEKLLNISEEMKHENTQLDPILMQKEECVPPSLSTRFKDAIIFYCKVLFFLVCFFFGIAFTYFVIDSTSHIWGKPLIHDEKSITPVSTTTDIGSGIKASNKLQPPPCFTSTIETPDEDQMQAPPNLLSKGITSCQITEAPVPCPHGGICFGGYLQTCSPGDILEVNSSNEGCNLTRKGEDILLLMKNRLVEMTVERTCGCWMIGWINGRTDCLARNANVDHLSDVPAPILFHADALCEALDIPHNAVLAMSHYWSTNDIILHQTSISPEHSYAIGFSASFLHNEIPIPAICYASILGHSIFKFIFSTMYSTILASSTFLVRCFLNYPIPTVFIMFFIFVGSVVRNRRKRTQALRKVTRKIREKVYEKLKLRGEEKCSEQHLRDDIAHEMYPDSLRDRKRLMIEIWPRVQVEVRCDSRVARSFRNGMEWWEWADRSSTAKMSH